MLFNSIGFVIFILIFSVISLFINAKNLKYFFITISSLFFYGFFEWKYIFIILISGSIDFILGLLIAKNDKYKKALLFTSIFTNIGILFSFKYLKFGIVSLNALMTKIGLSSTLHLSENLTLILPIGISFYTFQSLSYVIDIYRGQQKPTKNFFQFFAYLSFFPQLIAGPIVRAKDLLDNIHVLKLQKGEELYQGLKLIIFGYFKKTVLADGVAKFVNTAFVTPVANDSSLYWWLVAVCFAIQIYCDFSGYTDIARGIARIFGLHLPVNFKNPYIATSFQNFWQRWHISLSTWFKDYVYIPLGGSRGSLIKNTFALWITMLLSGLWHGANYTFLIWGAWHALLLTLERFLSRLSLSLPIPLRTTVIFLLVLFGWVLFRSNNLGQFLSISKAMLVFNTQSYTPDGEIITILSIFGIREIYVFLKEYYKFEIKNFYPLEPIWLGAMAACSIFLRGDGNEFIYFQF